MELRHLRYFCAVAEEMHVTRAAERLRVAQPALTQQIKALEAELKTPLLRRVGRGIELTEAGAAFWREAQGILDRVRAAALLAKGTARGFAGNLAIGLTETATFAPPVAKLVKHARELWPGVELSLSQGRTSRLIAALLERRTDVAFVRSPAPAIDALQCRLFLTEGLVVVLPNTHPLAANESVDVSALDGEPLILPHGRSDGEATELRTRIFAAFTRLGHNLRIVQETPEYIMAINLVAAGLGISLVPAVLAGLRNDAVLYKPFQSTPPFRTDIVMVTRAGDPSPIIANFLALAIQDAPHELAIDGDVPQATEGHAETTSGAPGTASDVARVSVSNPAAMRRRKGSSPTKSPAVPPTAETASVVSIAQRIPVGVG